MDCCQCQGFEEKFTPKYVAKKLSRYHKKGTKDTTQQLVEALQGMGVSGLTLLDIGGGIGEIQHALLEAGVSFATDNEAALAYIDACREEAERQGHADRIRHIPGNFVEVAKDIEPADIVTLDRVICCYSDMPTLVNLSAQKAKKLYGVVYPLDRWWVWLVMQVYYNFRHWILRIPMRNYVYPSRDIEAQIQSNGLRRAFYKLMGPWQIAVYARS